MHPLAVLYPDPVSPSPAAASTYVLPRLPYTRLRFTLRAAEPSTLPPFKGSLLRGAFGHALRRAACAMGPEQPCESCRLRAVCVYTRVFETYVEGESPPFLQGLPDAPRPYVFEPGTEALTFAPGAALPFDLLLVGRAAEHLPYVLLAVERMAAAGLGSRRHPFTLHRAEALTPDSWQPVFADGRALNRPVAPLFPSEDVPAGRARLRFLTPTRLKSKGQLQASVDFRGLAFTMLRRVLELAWFHVPGAEIDWTFRPLLDRASAVKVRASDLAWKDWQRYSNRQQRSMTLGGFVGTMEVEGDLTPFGPLLRTAEVVHVGKGATFGMGRVELGS
jgi:hypothetical protein